MKPVTLYDVAEYAGVSYQTVSRVVNQASHVSAKTREKVEAAMAQLNYIPNRVAQQLAGKQSLLIGVATSFLYDETGKHHAVIQVGSMMMVVEHNSMLRHMYSTKRYQ